MKILRFVILRLEPQDSSKSKSENDFDLTFFGCHQEVKELIFKVSFHLQDL